ncbi:MAG: tetratricopeptide repeat protein [Candidatus Xenobiia bacterium LiM19]
MSDTSQKPSGNKKIFFLVLIIFLSAVFLGLYYMNNWIQFRLLCRQTTRLMETHQFDKAMETVLKARSLNPRSPYTYALSGVIYQWKKDEEKALPDFDKAISLNPRYSNAYACRSEIYLGRNQFDLALRDADEAVRLEPRNSKGVESRLFINLQMGQTG